MELMLSDTDPDDENHKGLGQIDHLDHRIASVAKKISQVCSYQVQNYCPGAIILDLDAASEEDSTGQ